MDTLNHTGGTIKIMVVEDSAVVRGLMVRRLSQEPNFAVVASLANGEMAVQSIRHHAVDVVLLDIEMPVMDGMTALPKLLALAPGVKVIMASTLTVRNADISLRALQNGASDYIPKPSLKDDKDALEKFYREMIAKVNALGRSAKPKNPAAAAPRPLAPAVAETPPLAAAQTVAYPLLKPKALAIASSTGGPQALTEIFHALGGRLSDVPIFITQHMPPTFTKILATHISQAGGKECHEATHGEAVKSGTVYLAPGDYHMIPRSLRGKVIIELNQNPEVNYCRPAADPMIDGLVDVYGKHLLLAVLTGMGQDGLQGARRLHEAGGTVIAQERESCVVWGMPKAVTEQRLCKAVLPLKDVAEYLVKAFGGGSA